MSALATSSGLFILMLLAAQLSFIPTTSAQTPDTRRMVFGFVPALSPQNLATRFQPFSDYLGNALGAKIRLETAPDFPAFLERATVDRRYAFMFSAGNLYYMTRVRAGYRAIVRIALPAVQAIILTHADSGITNLGELKGRKIATLDDLALSTVLGAESLSRAGLIGGKHFSMLHVATQNASMQSALRRGTDAAIVIDLVYARLPQPKKQQLRVLARSRKFLHHPISVAPWVSEALAERARASLLGLSSSADGKSILARMHWPGFVRANADDYDTIMRQLESGVRDK